MPKPVRCLNEGCGKRWDMDPALAVACPDCNQPSGSPCKRPSGHAIFAGGVHGARDLAADKNGAYGVCPMGGCGDYARSLKARDASSIQPELVF